MLRAMINGTILMLVVAHAAAAPPAVVELVQAPAWVVRGDVRQPLALAGALDADDRIETGRGARVIIRLAEGSTVKLGEDATLHLAELVQPPGDDGVFGGFLDVVKGAFRFTTTAIGKARGRDVTARVRTVTVGIRGTDVWGKAEPDRDFVVLLEGRIDVERDGDTIALDEPLSLFMAPRGQPADPVRPVDPDDLARWAAETEPREGEGVQSIDGRVDLHLASYSESAGARRLVAKLASAGYGAVTADVTVGGRDYTRVTIPGFTDATDARAALSALAGIGPFDGAWLGR